MKFKVCFKLERVKTRPVLTGYRPTWANDSKPDQNSGALTFDDKDEIKPGEIHVCYLHPLASEYWNNVKPFQWMKCMEGSKVVGVAIILERIE